MKLTRLIHLVLAGVLVLPATFSDLVQRPVRAQEGDNPAESPATPKKEPLEKFVPSPEQLRGGGRAGRGLLGRNSTPKGRTGRGSRGRVYKTRIEPNWFDNDARFWYVNELRGGNREFILVDCERGTRQPAFDHARLAKALADAAVEGTRADRLPVERLRFDVAANTVEFRAGAKRWRLDLENYQLAEATGAEATSDAQPGAAAQGIPRRSSGGGEETELTFVNRTAGEVELFWLDTAGRRRSYGKLAAGDSHRQHTFAGHVWEVVDSQGRTLALFEGKDQPSRAEIAADARPLPRRERPRGRGPPRFSRGPRDTSPDRKWTALVRDGNVFIRPTDGGDEIQLSRDGSAEVTYDRLEWSPDSLALAAFRIEPGDRKEVHLIESSPPGGGRAVLHTREYALPGDKFASYELNLFDVAAKKHIRPEVDRIDFGTPRLRWKQEGHTFTYEKVDRGHQRFRLVEIDALSGESRNLIDEQTETFIWTAHTENLGVRMVTWLDGSDEILYVSERDGWRHLYLVDAREGKIKNQITKGEWVVRGVDRIDEEKRQIWFRASGAYADQDPYFIHYYRVNFDGTGLVALTDGNGTHSIAYSPGGKYLLDTWSRVDMPPVHELRRTSDGKLVCKLEQADASELIESGWEPPEVFVAKGRDDKTDIWGIICRPGDLDPRKRYPVIEQIYAGPQGSYVPKSFSTARRFSSLTDLGFIVVQIDGMGTANRSKAFHDVCWQNLKDAGLPDRVLWHKAAAAKYPYYDLGRVGIYGTSAGGQNSTAAVLFHGDFYQAAVSACGCHDNRMDKASWNEQWMGYPVGPQYAASSNIENAARLRGRLLLIVGEMDTNVPPESTLRLADALIKAGKDFDLLVVPGAGHGMGGTYGRRRIQDFFVRHLHGVDPTDRNAR